MVCVFFFLHWAAKYECKHNDWNVKGFNDCTLHYLNCVSAVLGPSFVQLMHTNYYKIVKQLKSFTITIVAPTCFGLHKPSSGSSQTVLRWSYNVDFAYLLTYLLITYSMVQSPSSEPNWFTASQEIPRISRNPKVHYRTHKRPPPVPILGQPNLVHIPTSHFLEIHLNTIHPSTPRSPQWSPSFPFPHQDPIHPSPQP